MKLPCTFIATVCSTMLAGAVAAGDIADNADVIQVAATFAEDTGSAERIESAELLRTYTQEVAAAACFLYNDIDRELSVELLIEAHDGFDKHIDALLNGNETLGIIGGEQRRKTIAELETIKTAWAPVSKATEVLLEDPKNTDAVGIIKAKNMELFDMTNILVSDMEGQYADPAVLMQSDVLTLEIIGRQSTMSQMIAKNACKMFSGNTSDEIKSGLEQSMQIYELSMDALINGMPQMGIAPAPTDEIATALKHVRSDWAKTRPMLDTLIETGEMARDDQIEMFRHMADEMHELEEITHAYALFSKH